MLNQELRTEEIMLERTQAKSQLIVYGTHIQPMVEHLEEGTILKSETRRWSACREGSQGPGGIIELTLKNNGRWGLGNGERTRGPKEGERAGFLIDHIRSKNRGSKTPGNRRTEGVLLRPRTRMQRET